MTPFADVASIGKTEGLLLSRVQYERFADVVSSLAEDEWLLPTDCPGWDVKAIASHVLGGLECVRAPRELVRQLRLARRAGGNVYDALNDVQVREHRDLPGAEIAQRLCALAGPALAHRARTPRLLRALVRPTFDVSGTVRYGWVLDVIYTRDTFLHRVDVCRATGRDVVADETEQRVVADIAREWAGRHGRPVTLRLTGPAGGTYVAGDGGETVECDAVEFARLLSGRGEPAGLLAVPVQF